jgi:hypothetical protein
MADVLELRRALPPWKLDLQSVDAADDDTGNL